MEPDEIVEDARAKVVDTIIAHDWTRLNRAFTVKAPIMLTVKLASGQFRKIPVQPWWELSLKGFYRGKKRPLIAVFDTVSPTKYKDTEELIDSIEVSADEINQHFQTGSEQAILEQVGWEDFTFGDLMAEDRKITAAEQRAEKKRRDEEIKAKAARDRQRQIDAEQDEWLKNGAAFEVADDFGMF